MSSLVTDPSTEKENVIATTYTPASLGKYKFSKFSHVSKPIVKENLPILTVIVFKK